MNKQKLVKAVKAYFKDEEIDIKRTIEREDAMKLINFLEDAYPKRLLHFNILERSSDCDYWFEAATYADLKSDGRSRFITIVFDHEVKLSEDFDDLIEDIIGLEDEAQKVQNSLDPVRYVVKLDK